MTSEEIIGRLRENEAALRARGAHAALFGSQARGFGYFILALFGIGWLMKLGHG